MHSTGLVVGALCALVAAVAIPEPHDALQYRDNHVCTSTITATLPFGCTVGKAAHTCTTSIDCHGCVLSTTSVPNTFFGHGPVCVNGIITHTKTHSTATATACITDS